MVEVSTSILSVDKATSIKTFYDLEVAKTDYFHIDDIEINSSLEYKKFTDSGYKQNRPYGYEGSNVESDVEVKQIVSLCGAACGRWADIHNGKESQDFSEMTDNDLLNRYLVYSAKNSFIQGIADSVECICVSYGFSDIDEYVSVSGTYKDKNNSYGMFTFIMERSDDCWKINDMIYNYKGSLDNIYRNDFMYDPKPDFWSDAERYEVFVEKLDGFPDIP